MARNVALFITCLTDQFYPAVGMAVTRVLEHYGCRVEFPSAQTCCGQPFFNNGYHAEARDLARRWITTFEPFDAIVSPSASCCSMVRAHFQELFQDDPAWSQRAKNVAGRTYEFVEFLEKVLQINPSKLALKDRQSFTYHYICHLRGLGIKDQGINFLKQIGNVDFRPMEKTDQCCGFGGTFAMKYPAISGAIVEDKMECIVATGAQTLVCNDAGCTMNISGMCHRHKAPVQTRHIAEIIAEAIGLDMENW